MANLVKHRFASGKTDGPDATQVQPSHWNDGHLFAGGNAGDLLTRDPTDATYGAKWTPQSSLIVPPAWVDVPFNAGSYSATGGTWTVAGVQTYAYLPNGKTILLTLYTTQTAIGGTPASLDIVLGWTIARQMSSVFNYYFSGGTGTGFATATVGSQTLKLHRDILGTPWAAGTCYITGVFLLNVT